MYKTIAVIIVIVFNIGFSFAYAQEFSFTPPASSNPSSSSSNITPARESTLSSTDFANSSVNAYQAQQAKVSALAAQQLKDTQMNKTNQAGAAPKPIPEIMQKPATTPEPPKPINQESPNMNATPLPTATPPPAPTTQPYTGFQKPSSNYPSRPTPNNNQNSNGWGSSIKY
jgi:hypothetical protein